MADSEGGFKTTLVGGYDKEDVEQEFQRLKDNMHTQIMQLKQENEQLQKTLDTREEEYAELERVCSEKDVQIASLQTELSAKEHELLQTEKDLREKYQSYVENYESISSLLYDAKIRAKQIEISADEECTKKISEAETEADRIRQEARMEAERSMAEAQVGIEEKTRDGQERYNTLQEELHHVIGLYNQVRKEFMASYKNVQQIVNDLPEVTDPEEEMLAQEGPEE